MTFSLFWKVNFFGQIQNYGCEYKTNGRLNDKFRVLIAAF